MELNRFALAAAIAAALPATAAFGSELAEVIVTAERRAENVQRIASAVSVLSGETVELAEVRNAGDVIRFVPNMTADTTDGHGRPKFYIRGIGLSDASIWNTNPIGTYVDDVYVWNASTVGFPVFDVERVEVLRGPQGTLWGKNTTGGAINFISKKPTFENEGYAKVAYGNFDEALAEGALGFGINDIFAVRVSGFYQEADLFTQNSFQPGTDTWDETAGRVQLLGKFSDSFDAVLKLHYRDFNGPVLTGGNLNNAIATRWNVPSLAERTDDLTQVGTALTLTKTFANGLALTSISGFDNFEREQTGGDAVPYESTRTRTAFEVDQFSQELRLASPGEDRLSWIAGAYYFDGTITSDAQTAALPGSLRPNGTVKPISYTTNEYALDAQSYALFGNVKYRFTDRFDLSLGVRETWEKKEVDLVNLTAATGFSFADLGRWWESSNINGALPVNAFQQDDKTWSAFTWEITPGFQFTDTLRGYARVAEGFNGGNFNATATRQNQVGVIEPEYLRSYEVGVKSEWLENRLVLNLSTFYYYYTDIQQKATTLDSNNQQVITFINAKSGVSKGIELEASLAPVEDLVLRLNLGYNETEFTDFQDSPTTNVAGNWFNRVPRVISNAQAEYRIPLSNGGGVLLSTDWAYRTKSYFNATNQTDAELIEPAYWLGNASVGYSAPNRKYDVRVYGLNVTNTEYRNTSLLGGSYSFGPPRTYGVAATVRFD